MSEAAEMVESERPDTPAGRVRAAADWLDTYDDFARILRRECTTDDPTVRRLLDIAGTAADGTEVQDDLRAAADLIESQATRIEAALALRSHYDHDYEMGNVHPMFHRGFTVAMRLVAEALEDEQPPALTESSGQDR